MENSAFGTRFAYTGPLSANSPSSARSGCCKGTVTTRNRLARWVLSACNAPVSLTGEVPEHARKTVPSVVPRCPYWCHSVFLVLSQFSPFRTPDSRGQGHRYGPKARAINAKKPRENSGFRGKTLHFEVSCRSGETGIRTLGTRKGTPVFKTGAFRRIGARRIAVPVVGTQSSAASDSGCRTARDCGIDGDG